MKRMLALSAAATTVAAPTGRPAARGKPARRLAQIVVAACLMLILTPAAAVADSPSSTDAITGWVYIVNSQTRNCLAIGHGSTKPGAEAVQWGCNGGNEQKWLITGTGRSTLRYGKNSNLCLAIPRADPNPGVTPIIWTCSTNEEQLWYGFADQHTHIENASTALCLDGISMNTSVVFQYYCQLTPFQLWYFVRAPAP